MKNFTQWNQARKKPQSNCERKNVEGILAKGTLPKDKVMPNSRKDEGDLGKGNPAKDKVIENSRKAERILAKGTLPRTK